MKRFVQHIIILIALPLIGNAQQDLKFNSIDSLFSFADHNSSVAKTNEQQTILARYQKIAALANTVNFRDPVALSLTNNTQLPVSFLPAQLLGGPAGEFKQITLGQQYNSNFTITPQIDIINPGAWAQVKTASISEEITSTRNLLSKKSLYESIAACYYNIASFHEQVSITQKNSLATDTLLLIVNNKYAQGLVRQQDVNDASINKLLLQDKLKQLEISLEQQYNSLKILCDIPISTNLILEDELNYRQQFVADMNANSQLQLRTSMLQADSAKADLRCNRLSNLPVLSLLYSNSYYQYSNNRLLDNNTNPTKWLNSVYIGAKVTFNLPDVNRILVTRNSQIKYQTSLIRLEHNRLQTDISNNQLKLDYEKAYSQFSTSGQIFLLKEENYKMAFKQFNQSILSFDKLLVVLNDMLTSRLNYSSALANLLFTKTKIDINNKLK